MKRWLCLPVLVCVCFLTGCDKETKKGSSVKAKFAFANATSLNLDTTGCPDLGDGELEECWTPTVYGMKLVNIIVSPDQAGAQTGPAGLIWAAPGCAISSTSTTIEDAEFEYDSASDCTDDQVDTFLELARPTADVNAELNSQAYNILPGTYNYVQLEFCKGAPSGPNGRFQAEGMTAPHETTSGMCGLSSLKADPAIVVGEGESVTISLSYDLTNTVYVGHSGMDSSSCYKSEDNSFIRCATGPKNLTPSFAQSTAD